MNLWKAIFWSLVFVATTISQLPSASAELLYDEDISAQAADPRTDERGEIRQVLGASHRAQTTVQAQPVVVSQPAALAAESPSEVQNYSKAELMRRQRMRAEVQNEDILQERLEELRLRDEKRRTDQLMGARADQDGQQAGQAVASVGLSEEVIVSPVTERPGQLATPVVRQPVVYTDAPPPAATTLIADTTTDEDKTRIWVQPRGGISQMTAKSYFETVPHYAAGVAAGVEVSENLGFELGYTFNEYGVKSAQSYMYMNPGATFESHAMKQNVFEGGLKLHFLGPQAKLRPFLTAGAAYTKSFVNYPDAQLNYFRSIGRNDLARDYESSSFVAGVGTGFDVRVSKSISVGAAFKYYKVLSTRENQNFYAGYYGYMQPISSDPTKDYLGQQLSVSSFYSILAGASFSF